MTQFRGIDPINSDNWIVAKAKQNPEAFLVLAAGCALLLRGSGLGSTSYRGAAQIDGQWNGARERTASAARTYAANLQDRVKETAAQASEKVSGYATALSDNASAISERASDYVSSLSDQATDWGRNVADEATRMGSQARTSLQTQAGRIVREQPFAVAALGVAVGAAVAALLPPSDAERDALKPIRNAASGAANVAADRIKEAVSATADQLKDAAEQKGLTSDGIKDLTRNVTQTFGDTLARGKTSQPGDATSSQAAPSPPGGRS